MRETQQDPVVLTAGDRVSRRLRYRHDRWFIANHDLQASFCMRQRPVKRQLNRLLIQSARAISHLTQWPRWQGHFWIVSGGGILVAMLVFLLYVLGYWVPQLLLTPTEMSTKLAAGSEAVPIPSVSDAMHRIGFVMNAYVLLAILISPSYVLNRHGSSRKRNDEIVSELAPTAELSHEFWRWFHAIACSTLCLIMAGVLVQGSSSAGRAFIATITAIGFSLFFFWMVDFLVVCLLRVRIRIPVTINAIMIPIMVLMMFGLPLLAFLPRIFHWAAGEVSDVNLLGILAGQLASVAEKSRWQWNLVPVLAALAIASGLTFLARNRHQWANRRRIIQNRRDASSGIAVTAIVQKTQTLTRKQRKRLRQRLSRTTAYRKNHRLSDWILPKPLNQHVVSTLLFMGTSYAFQSLFLMLARTLQTNTTPVIGGNAPTMKTLLILALASVFSFVLLEGTSLLLELSRRPFRPNDSPLTALERMCQIQVRGFTRIPFFFVSVFPVVAYGIWNNDCSPFQVTVLMSVCVGWGVGMRSLMAAAENMPSGGSWFGIAVSWISTVLIFASIAGIGKMAFGMSDESFLLGTALPIAFGWTVLSHLVWMGVNVMRASKPGFSS